jgi:hypothetical protein
MSNINYKQTSESLSNVWFAVNCVYYGILRVVYVCTEIIINCKLLSTIQYQVWTNLIIL